MARTRRRYSYRKSKRWNPSKRSKRKLTRAQKRAENKRLFRLARKGKSRKSTRRSTKSRRSKSSSRKTWVAKQKRLEMKARRKARWYQGKHRAKARRGGNSKSQLNRALAAARAGRWVNPRRRRSRRW